MATIRRAVLGVVLAGCIGATGACQDDPALGGLGEACNIDVQCRGDMTCEPTIESGENQCVAACTSDSDCAGFGEAACVTMNVELEDGGVDSKMRCAVTCTESLDCFRGGVCNTDGWCSRDSLPEPPMGTGGAGGMGGSGGGDAGGGAPGDAGGGAPGDASAPDAAASDAATD